MTISFTDTIKLLEKAQNGDALALEDIISRYKDKVLIIVRLRMGNQLRSQMDSQDIVQEALIRILKSYKDFKPASEGSFLHWASTLVQNTIKDKVDYISAQKRSVFAERPLLSSTDSDALALIDKIKSNEPTATENLIRKENKEKIEEVLQKLSAPQREIIIMRDIEEMSFREIGYQAGKNEDAVRMAYTRALKKLYELLEEENP